METPPRQAKPAQRRRRLVKALVAVVIIGLVGSGGGWLYVRHVGAEAKRVYELGSTLNAFFARYSTSLKKRNVEGILDLYDSNYLSEREGLLKEELSWQDGTAPEIESRVRVYTVKETDVHRFAKGDVRQQIEAQLAAMDYINFAKFKIERIEEQAGSDRATLKTLLWLRGQQESGETVETHIYLRLWLSKNDGWKIERREFLGGTTVRGRGKGITEVTSQAGLDFKAHHNPMFLEEQWKPEMFQIMRYSHGGVATADYDNDGWYDIYLCDGERPRLYRNLGNGKFEDVTKKAGLPETLPGVHVAIFADFNNDGFPDLFLGRSTA